MSKLSRELLIEQLIFTCGVSRRQVVEYIKRCSFSEYQMLSEATADRNPWLTSGTNGNNTANSGNNDQNPSNNQQPYRSNIDRLGDEFGNSNPNSTATDNGEQEQPSTKADGTKYGQDSKGTVYRLEREFGDEVEVTDKTGKTHRIKRGDFEEFDHRRDPSRYQKVKSLFTYLSRDRAFQAGAAFARKYMEDAEINRMQELAGITEVSVIGNTADSHKPTVQLRKKERIKRDQRERKRENKGYQPETRVKRDISPVSATNIRRDLK